MHRTFPPYRITTVGAGPFGNRFCTIIEFITARIEIEVANLISQESNFQTGFSGGLIKGYRRELFSGHERETMTKERGVLPAACFETRTDWNSSKRVLILKWGGKFQEQVVWVLGRMRRTRVLRVNFKTSGVLLRSSDPRDDFRSGICSSRGGTTFFIKIWTSNWSWVG